MDGWHDDLIMPVLAARALPSGPSNLIQLLRQELHARVTDPTFCATLWLELGQCLAENGGSLWQMCRFCIKLDQQKQIKLAGV